MYKLIKNHIPSFILDLVLSIIEIGTDILWAFVGMYILNYATGETDMTLETVIAISLGAMVIRVLFFTLKEAQDERLIRKVMVEYKGKILNTYIDSRGEKAGSEIINTLTNICNNLEQMYLKPSIQLIQKILLFIGASIAVIRIQWKLFLLIFLISWIPLVLPRVLDKRTQKLRGKALKQAEYFISRLRDITNGFEVIKAFNIESKMKKIGHKEIESNEIELKKANTFQVIHEGFGVLLTLIVYIIIFLFAGYMAKQGTITVGEILATTMLYNSIGNATTYITKLMIMIRGFAGEYKKLNEYIDSNSKFEGYKEFIFNRQLDIRDLSFSYDSKMILNNINLKIEKGKKYAIIGESGSGKSTLAKILLRSISGYEGEVLFDGIELKNIEKKSFYKGVSPVTQNVFIFNDSIRNNITLFAKYPEEEVEKAIKKSGLDKLISTLPEGVDTVIGEYGVDLSGGEKQRISIARCLIKKSDIIIMDEATSSLDKTTATNIEQLLLDLDKTVIVITHRIDPEILSQYEKIFVLKDGQFTEEGKWKNIREYKK
ncbi:ABC transporter ATP-binding protein [Lagierella sp.]|uniref:ABC transporter ATP-binding protein n=1 Tax=Lagierella sp. TaxID=2849657 RepID=UPI0026231C12|nr:ABC transporter ATP-binding protein [Lagierella sp.]